MFCVRCGTKLKQGRCRNCGFAHNLAATSNSSEMNDVENLNKHCLGIPKKRILIASVALAIIVISGGVLFSYMVFNKRYKIQHC